MKIQTDMENIARGTTDPGYWIRNLSIIFQLEWFQIDFSQKSDSRNRLPWARCAFSNVFVNCLHCIFDKSKQKIGPLRKAEIWPLSPCSLTMDCYYSITKQLPLFPQGAYVHCSTSLFVNVSKITLLAARPRSGTVQWYNHCFALFPPGLAFHRFITFSSKQCSLNMANGNTRPSQFDLVQKYFSKLAFRMRCRLQKLL